MATTTITTTTTNNNGEDGSLKNYPLKGSIGV